jgi:hypothetical protein
VLTKASEQPRYYHTCPRCQYLGMLKQYDLYFCDQLSVSRHGKRAVNPTVVARYSDSGPDYLSGLRDSDMQHEALLEAKNRAIAKNLIQTA